MAVTAESFSQWDGPPPPINVDNLGDDGHGNFGRIFSADIQTNRSINPLELGRINALLLRQKLEDGFHPALTADHPDVPDRRVEHL